jgi:hypothetical protein
MDKILDLRLARDFCRHPRRFGRIVVFEGRSHGRVSMRFGESDEYFLEKPREKNTQLIYMNTSSRVLVNHVLAAMGRFPPVTIGRDGQLKGTSKS